MHNLQMSVLWTNLAVAIIIGVIIIFIRYWIVTAIDLQEFPWLRASTPPHSLENPVPPDMIFHGVQTDAIMEFVDELKSKGIIVHSIYRVVQNISARSDNVPVMNPKFLVTASTDDKVLNKLHNIYSESKYDKLNRAIIIQKLIIILQKSLKFSFDNIQMLHDANFPELVSNLLKNPMASAWHMNEYLGPPATLYLQWLSLLCTWLLPGGFLAAVMFITGRHELSGRLCIFNSFVIGLGTAYARHAAIIFSSRLNVLKCPSISEVVEHAARFGKAREEFAFPRFLLSWILVGILPFLQLSLAWAIRYFIVRYLFQGEVIEGITLAGTYYALSYRLGQIFQPLLHISSDSLQKELTTGERASNKMLRIAIWTCGMLISGSIPTIILTFLGNTSELEAHTVTLALMILHCAMKRYFLKDPKTSKCCLAAPFLQPDARVEEINYRSLDFKDSIRSSPTVIRKRKHTCSVFENSKEDSPTSPTVDFPRAETPKKSEKDIKDDEESFAALIRESAAPGFDLLAGHADILGVFAAGLFLSPFSTEILAVLCIHLWLERTNSVALILTICRRLYPLEETCEPWLGFAEVVTVVSFIWTFATMFLLPVRQPYVFTITYFHWSAAFIVEHICLIFRVWLFPWFLFWIRESQIDGRMALQRLIEAREAFQFRLFRLKQKIAPAALTSDYSDILAGNPESWYSKLRMAEYQSGVGTSSSPLLWGVLSMTPFALQNLFNIPWWLVLLPLFLYMAQEQNKIARMNRRIAMGLVCDPQVLNLIMKQFPQFIFDSDMQRCEWCNTLMRACWTNLARYGEKIIHKIMDPMLTKNTPPFARKLSITKLDLGHIPVVILGIKVTEAKAGAEHAEVELDFKWPSALTASLSLFIGGTKVTASVTQLTFSGTVRMHLTPLIPFMPPFGMIKGTFMRKPQVDFNLSFGDVDFTDLGYSGGSVSFALQKILRKILETMVVYPKWMNVEAVDPAKWNSGVEPSTFSMAAPHGVLSISVLRCSDLIIGDITTSDPYVKVSLLDDTYETPVIYRNLNPAWEGKATYSFLVHDKAQECLDIEVWDKDFSSSDEFLGRTQFFIDSLKDGEVVTVTLPLEEVKHGDVTIQLAYFKLAKADEESSVELENDETDKLGITDLFDENARLILRELVDDYIGDGSNAEQDHEDDDNRNDSLYRGLNLELQPNQDSVRPHHETAVPFDPSILAGKVGNFFLRRSDSDAITYARSTSKENKPLSSLLRPLIVVAGVLTISSISVRNLRINDGVVTSGGPTPCFVFFSIGKAVRTTSISQRQSNVDFKETFHIVVGDVFQDLLRVKLCRITPVGFRQTLASFKVRVRSVAIARENQQQLKEDVGESEKHMATGILSLLLTYRAAAR